MIKMLLFLDITPYNLVTYYQIIKCIIRLLNAIHPVVITNNSDSMIS